MKKVGKILWSIFSEADERYLDLVRILLALSVLTILGLAIHQEARGESVDLLALGGALAGLLFGGGAAIGARARLEDGNPREPIGTRHTVATEPDEWGLP